MSDHVPTFFFLGLFLIISCSESGNTNSLAHIEVPKGFQVELAAGPDLVDYPMFATLDGRGRLFVFESIGNVYENSEQAMEDPQFRIKLLEDLDGDGKYDKATIFADSLSFPQGGVFIDDSLIASSAPDLLKLTDTDGDGVADQRQVLLSGWVLNVNANSLIGPFLGPDGWLYMTSAIEGFDVNSKEGERIEGETARIWKVRPDGSELQWVSAGGMNNPVELTFTPAGEVIGTQTFFVDPQRGVRDAITYWTEGGIYGKKNSNIDRDSLPRTGGLLPVITQYSRVAPSGIGIYRHTVFGEDFENNLFSTQFNTHRVIRHKLVRKGASFSTVDQPFLWTDNQDFHPTDVLEDADGSLLVVETGGWFILGCPLSQVSKSQLKGSIYRIRREGAPVVEDPYGDEVPWESLEVEDLADYLEDPRPFVSDRAQKELITRGEDAIHDFKRRLAKSTSISSRIKAVYGLYQLNSDQAWEAMKEGFRDAHLEVRIATAKAAGLTGSNAFVDELSQMLSKEPPAVRQAATALGLIGEPAAIRPLLEAVKTTNDRFVRHAITYALICLNRPHELLMAIDGASDNLAPTILIALDQMTPVVSSPKMVQPYLENKAVRETALWVASRHPEWASEMIGYLENRLNPGKLSVEEEDVYDQLMISYCGTPEMQRFLEEMLSQDNKQVNEQALTIMSNCQTDPFPGSWQQVISELLIGSKDAGTLMQAVELVKLRGLSGLTRELTAIVGNQDRPVVLRIAAISALLPETSTLSDQQFSLLCSQFHQQTSPVIAQQAANTITSADLTNAQLSYLAYEVLPILDPFVLPGLLPAFEGAEDLEVGQKLVEYLLKLPSLDNLTEEYLSELFSYYPPEIAGPLNDLISRLRMVREDRIQKISLIEQAVGTGNEERGRALYFGKAICYTCHTVREGGGTLGPDLTSIQHDRSVHDIIEAIIYPSVSFVRDYETYKIITNTGEFRGIIQEQTPDMVLLGTGPETSVRIPTIDITSVEPLEVSMMPQGLDQLLTEQEFNDLMAYLLGRDLVY